MAVFSGTAGANSLRGTTARDTLAGYSGDDWLDGGNGADLVIGGPGADTFIWDEHRNSSAPTLDQYIGGDWNDFYDPNPYGELSGGDKLFLGASAGAGGFRVFFNTTEAGSANDAYGNRLNFSGIERIETGAGNDFITAQGARIVAARNPGGAANYVPEHGLTALGGGGNDTIIGSSANDVLDGGEGNDRYYGGDGEDLLMSSAGDDYGHAGGGNDNVRWGNNGGTSEIYDVGNDTLIGGDGHDLINLWGKVGGDNSIGTVVNFYSASSGYATFAPSNGRVTFSEFEQYWTHEGRDTVSGANADVAVNGTGIWFNTRWGDDILTGTNGRDTLEGGEHADTINGGRGDDIISMWEDAYYADGSRVAPDGYRDVLIIEDGAGTDRVRAFQVGDVSGRPGDRLDVSNLHDAQGNRVDVNDVVVSSQGSNAMLVFPNGERVILEGVSPSTLTRATLIEMGIPSSTAQAAQQTTRVANAPATDASAIDSTGGTDAAAAGSNHGLLGLYSSDTVATTDGIYSESLFDMMLG